MLRRPSHFCASSSEAAPDHALHGSSGEAPLPSHPFRLLCITYLPQVFQALAANDAVDKHFGRVLCFTYMAAIFPVMSAKRDVRTRRGRSKWYPKGNKRAAPGLQHAWLLGLLWLGRLGLACELRGLSDRPLHVDPRLAQIRLFANIFVGVLALTSAYKGMKTLQTAGQEAQHICRQARHAACRK